MEVTCHFQSSATGLSSPICSYLIPKPFKSQNIVELFPYEGCNFIFRIKMSLAALGIPNPSNDHVWLDLTADVDKSINWEKVNDYFPGGKVDVKVVAVDADVDDEFEGFGDYESFLNESMTFMTPQNRPSRPEISPREATASSKNTSSFTSVATSAASYVSAFIPQSSKSNVDTESSSTSSSTSSAINLKSVQKGASSLWNALKSTTEKIQSQGLGGIFNVDANPTISKKAYANLTTLAQLMATSYQDSNPQHGYIIMKLWETTFPDELPPPSHGSDGGLMAESPLWKTCGWQKDHPVHDLKISGLLALNTLSYFGEVYKEISQDMIGSNRSNTKQNYPYAIVGVNLTLLLADLFSLKDNEFLTKQAGYWSMFDEPEAFYELFSLSFMHVDIIWRERQAVRSQFGAIIGDTKAVLTRILTKQPATVQEFRTIGADEGLKFKF